MTGWRPRNTPGGLKDGISEMGVEVAMRGTRHVTMGIERGARYASRQWGAMIHNCRTNNTSVSQLYGEYEAALQKFQENNPTGRHGRCAVYKAMVDRMQNAA